MNEIDLTLIHENDTAKKIKVKWVCVPNVKDEIEYASMSFFVMKVVHVIGGIETGIFVYVI